MYLVRKITRAKWDRPAGLAAGEIPADAVTADLRTTDNALSLWASTDADGDGLNDAVLALVAGAKRVDKVDVVWIERAKVVEAGVEVGDEPWRERPKVRATDGNHRAFDEPNGQELDETEGRTPVTDLVDRHVDAVRLDLVRLGRFAEQVTGALGVGQHKRLTKKRVAQLIASAVNAGRVPLADLEEEVQAQASKYVE